MQEASGSLGHLRLQWNALETIDPVLYEFEDKFSMKLRSLRLVGVQLRELPTDFGNHLMGLEILSLCNNDLIYIPDSVVNLTNLRELNLIYNKITHLPARIGLMCSLERLFITNNSLLQLPITFGALNLLTLVDIECNSLTVLPENLDNMVSCRTLNLNNNKLVRLPRCLAKMPSLTHLSASRNALTYVPYELMASRSIEVLRLNTNAITHIPERIGDMAQLKELSFDYNKITRLPASFYKLTELKMLRLEGNEHLSDPPQEIILKGAVAVVEHCREKYMYDRMGRMRSIVTSVQAVLRQAHEAMLTDPSLFEPDVIVDASKDTWYALQMTHFWHDLLPRLKIIWRQRLQRNETSSSLQELTDFPYSEREVLWALSNFSDVYGMVFRQHDAMFRRCSCTTSEGIRRPCVPPKVGFMCLRFCTLIKMNIIRQRDKEDRAWQQKKADGIREAEMRATTEAKRYLDSGPGQHWLTTVAYEQAENMVIDQRASVEVQKRHQRAEQRKQEIVARYAKKRAKLESIRDKKVRVMQDELAKYKLDLKKAKEGYMKTAIEERIDALVQQIAKLPEVGCVCDAESILSV
jgi:Leucine-rich repeat (LRR) protein